MNRSALQLSALVAVSLVTANFASAQVCLGSPSLAVAPTNIGVSADFTDGAKGVSGHFGFGSDRTFGGIGVGLTSFSDADASATTFSGFAGTAVAPSPTSGVRICPVIGATYGYGPNEETSIGKFKISSLGLSAGVAIGGAVVVSPGFSVIPNVSGGVLHQRIKVSLDGDSESASETGGSIGGGVGLLFGEVFTLEPSITVPLGFSSNDPIFSIGLTIGLKRRK